MKYLPPKLLYFSHYGGERVEDSRFLASAKKNVLILRAAAIAGFEIDAMVTSCCPLLTRLDASIQRLCDRKQLIIWRWPSIISPAFSRFFCLFLLPLQLVWFSLFRAKPSMIAFYNTLASESLALIVAKFIYPSVPCILFYDDHLLARKPSSCFNRRYLDNILWLVARKHGNLKHAFVVNHYLESEILNLGIAASLLPCLVDSNIRFNLLQKPNNSPLKICYSGGLEVEKGASLLLELGRQLPLAYQLDITGNGSLESDFISLSKEISNLHFHGIVDDAKLLRIHLDCDIFLCLHSEMNGIFPFKIIEALYRGLIVISSPLDPPSWLCSSDGLFVVPAISYVNNPVASILDTLILVSGYVEMHADRLGGVQEKITKYCSVASLADKLKVLCGDA